MKVPPIKPTDAELNLLQVLWRRGPSTLKEVHQEVKPSMRYTSTQTFLMIMIDKGLVRRNSDVRPAVFEAIYSEEQTQRHLLSILIRKVFGGSAERLVFHALAAKKYSKSELAALQRLINQQKK